MLKKPVARIITRIQGEGDGFFMGSLLAGGLEDLKSNSIYELQKCLLTNDIILKYIGESNVAAEGDTLVSSPIQVHWAQEIQTVLQCGQPYIWLSKEELENLNEH